MNESLSKLVRLARRAYNAPEPQVSEDAPLGFATRVAARWAAEARQGNALDAWRRLSWWGATASLFICLSAAAYRATLPEPNAFDVLLEQPLVEVDEF